MKKLTLLALSVTLLLGCMNDSLNTTGTIEIADSTLCSLGEGAIWDADGNRLFYIDIIGKKLFEFDPVSGDKTAYEMPSMIGTVVVDDKDHVIVALEDGIYRYNLEKKNLEFLACPPENDSTQRFNDGKCDPAGRFWVGTMSLTGGKESSHLFSMDKENNVKVKLDGITISNGIVWTSDKKQMYYIDTPTKKVMEYSYENATGNISNPRIAVTVADSLGSPDGMAIDADDNIWVCMWGGSAVCKFDPQTGKLLKRIMVPAKNVTSCAFSGPDLRDLYITTARIGTGKEALEEFPNAGALFMISTKEKGAPTHVYNFETI
ncbi:MAG: SMP-30/gluconolactonase/LRE family protein [Bacteroidales bacterium]|nr:SMP-30/gluconolactonase/LRE family protein [Bacteroidales bacterium]